MALLSKCKEVLRVTWEQNSTAWIFFVLIAFACVAASLPKLRQANSQDLSRATALQATDPNKGPSELNHHIAGWALIGVGMLSLASLVAPQRRAYRYIWPGLFMLAGGFLALWSDGEIWPRGNLNWFWLFQHDSEARQHKIYSVLLCVIGIIEYVRISGFLPRFWKIWAFPMLAVVGSGLLLIHDHASGSGARSPEAQAYLVNPALDVNGNAIPTALTMAVTTSEDRHSRIDEFSQNAMGDSVLESNSMAMNHSQMAIDVPPVVHTHHYLMSASMLRVEHQHMWFMIIGLAIGVFKFLSDSELFHSRIFPYMWPSCMVLLGVMLVFYRE